MKIVDNFIRMKKYKVCICIYVLTLNCYWFNTVELLGILEILIYDSLDFRIVERNISIRFRLSQMFILKIMFYFKKIGGKIHG